MNRAVIAIDLGGTTIKAALVRGHELLISDSIPARSSEGLAPQLPRLADLIRHLCEKAETEPAACAGMGLAVPFLVDPVARRILSTPKDKYSDAAEIDLPAWGREMFGLDLQLENDARAACLGEWWHGAGQGVEDLVMFTLGTEIGCSVILRGRPLRGKRHQAGVVCGHMISDPEGPPCTCCAAVARWRGGGEGHPFWRWRGGGGEGWRWRGTPILVGSF